MMEKLGTSFRISTLQMCCISIDAQTSEYQTLHMFSIYILTDNDMAFARGIQSSTKHRNERKLKQITANDHKNGQNIVHIFGTANRIENHYNIRIRVKSITYHPQSYIDSLTYRRIITINGVFRTRFFYGVSFLFFSCLCTPFQHIIHIHTHTHNSLLDFPLFRF